MARMHSRDKGKSGSTKPYVKATPAWQTHKTKEIEALIAKLAKEKLSGAQIGIRLRDTYGIPSVKTTTGKTISTILAEKKLNTSLPEDLLFIIKKYIKIQKHRETNNQDNTSKRGLQLTHSKLLRLAKYYKANGKIDKNWKFDSNRAGIYLE